MKTLLQTTRLKSAAPKVALIALAILAGCAPQGPAVGETAPKPTPAAQAQPATQSGLVWIADGRLTARGEVMRQTLAWAETHGVCSANYGVSEIDSRLAKGGAENWEQADALLSAGFTKFAEDVSGSDLGEPEALLAAASSSEDFRRFLTELEPDDPDYQRLKQALDLYAAIAESGGWQTIAAGPALKPGMTHAQVPSLRRRLHLTGDLKTGDPRSPVFDAALEAAVRRFQTRHGLAVDGIVGRETRAALNVPARLRAATIARNLCLYPDLAAITAGTAVVVNVPGAELRFFHNGELRFTSRVIVGRDDWPTPIINDAISAIELNPYWNIPPRIARLEVIPRIIKDPTYLATRNIRVLSLGDTGPRELDPANIDWASLGAGSLPFRLRQEPGPQNPMGTVKFRLNNPYHVFLHDTPARQLFDQAKRNLSHGCVRVQQAQLLANLILELRTDVAPEEITRALEDGEQLTIRLREPLPVHLVAIGAWVDADGLVNFRGMPTGDVAEKSCIASLNAVAGNL